MSLVQLRTFLEVYRQSSLSKAAKQLSLSQPAVSQQIASLETQLGRTLFDRNRRGVTPTLYANELASALGDSLDRAEAVLAIQRARSSELSGVVHIAGPAEYIGEQIVTLLTSLTTKWLQLRIRLGNRDAIYRQLAAGDVDLAITASTPDDKRFDHALIAEEHLWLIAPAEMAIPKTPAQLIASQPFCAYDSDLPLVRKWTEANGIALPNIEPSVTIPDLRTLLKFVESGAGWSVIPDYIAKSAISARRVQHCFPSATQPSNSLNLVWLRGNLRHPRVAYTKRLLLES